MGQATIRQPYDLAARLLGRSYYEYAAARLGGKVETDRSRNFDIAIFVIDFRSQDETRRSLFAHELATSRLSSRHRHLQSGLYLTSL